MSTPAIVTVNNEQGDSLVHVYQQHDGMDVEETIKKFVDGKEMWNGIPGGKSVPDDGFNGMDSLAAHLVKHMLSITSSIYILSTTDVEDYIGSYRYRIDYIDGQIRVERVEE